MENAARAYVAANGDFNTDANKETNGGLTSEQLKDFYNSSLKFKATYNVVNGPTSDNILLPSTGDKYNIFKGFSEQKADSRNNYGVFSDGSAMSYENAWFGHRAEFGSGSWVTDAFNYIFKDQPQEKYGEIVGAISFTPNVKGLPNVTRKMYEFVITSKGFVYPWVDRCSYDAYKNNWKFDPASFKSGGNCYIHPQSQSWK